ncbi:MAG: type II toxin-antitoxin system VapC family toxin [Candidatus Promineifilaceae bacterium]
MLYILDTDHISLLQRGHERVIINLSRVEIGRRAVTIVTVSEQVQGRLAVIRRSRTEIEAARAFTNLQNTIAFYQAIHVLEYTEEAVAIFEKLRSQKIRVGTQDLRIAAIVLSQEATLVTRNSRDFAKIPDLSLEDWSV